MDLWDKLQIRYLYLIVGCHGLVIFPACRGYMASFIVIVHGTGLQRAVI